MPESRYWQAPFREVPRPWEPGSPEAALQKAEEGRGERGQEQWLSCVCIFFFFNLRGWRWDRFSHVG